MVSPHRHTALVRNICPDPHGQHRPSIDSSALFHGGLLESPSIFPNYHKPSLSDPTNSLLRSRAARRRPFMRRYLEGSLVVGLLGFSEKPPKPYGHCSARLQRHAGYRVKASHRCRQGTHGSHRRSCGHKGPVDRLKQILEVVRMAAVNIAGAEWQETIQKSYFAKQHARSNASSQVCVWGCSVGVTGCCFEYGTHVDRQVTQLCTADVRF